MSFDLVLSTLQLLEVVLYLFMRINHYLLSIDGIIVNFSKLMIRYFYTYKLSDAVYGRIIIKN